MIDIVYGDHQELVMNDFTNVKRKIEAIPNCCPKRQEKKNVKEDLDGDTTDSYQKVTDAVFRTKKERWKKFDVSGFKRCVLKYHKKSPAAFGGVICQGCC